MRTHEQIAAHIKENGDFFNFAAGILGPYLPASLYEQAGFEPAADPAAVVARPIDLAKVKEDILGYLDFAWEKCRNQRGLSASRSISKFRAWVWLLEDEEAIAFLGTDSNYAPYGEPMLAFLSNRYGFPIPPAE